LYLVGEFDHSAVSNEVLHCWSITWTYASGDDSWWISGQESPGGEETHSEVADWSGNVACNSV